MRDAALVRALLAWYARAARDLPWRRSRDPYAVWISEIMLQQTRVDTVVPYFERFLARFPDARALANAPLDDVLGLWSGLGYYRRARQLHAAAREIVDRYGGSLPEEPSELRGLSGIGAYTAGAIASIAFDRAEPLVDGNVARVLARLEEISDDVRSAGGSRRLWSAAARLVPARDPGAFNQALMDLGATICTPREPRCGECPLAPWCSAFRSGTQNELPVVRAKPAAKSVRVVAAVVRAGAKVLMGRRREDGLFGGMWEPPMVEAASIEAAAGPLGALGIDTGSVHLTEAGRVRHVLSHRVLEVLVASAIIRKPWRERPIAAPYDRAAWLDPDESSVGVSTLARKLLAAVLG